MQREDVKSRNKKSIRERYKLNAESSNIVNRIST